MTIRKKSLTGTLRQPAEAATGTGPPAPDSVPPSESRSVRQSLSAEDLTLSKRTVSRILLAKRLFGR